DLVRIQLDEQLSAELAAGQVTKAAFTQNEAGIATVIAEFRAGKPVNTSGLLASVATLFTGELFSSANAQYTRSDADISLSPPYLVHGCREGFLGPGSPVVPVWLFAPCRCHGLGGVAAGTAGA